MSKHSHSGSRHTKSKFGRNKVKRQRSYEMPWLKIVTVVGFALAVVGVLTFLAITNASAQSAPQLSAAKQQLVQSQAQWHAKVDTYKAPKGTLSTGSCPADLHHAPVIERLTPAQMATMHNAYASFASIISAENKPYFVFGENGKFVVQAESLDPCKTASNPQQNSGQTFQQVIAQGNLWITSVQGDLVTYKTSSGATGAFNYVTGQFQ